MLHVADNESKVGGSYTSIIKNEYNDKMFLIGGLCFAATYLMLALKPYSSHITYLALY